MIPKKIWLMSGLRTILFGLGALFAGLQFVQGQSYASFEPILIKETEPIVIGNLNIEEVMVELRRMKRSVGRNPQHELDRGRPFAQPCPVTAYSTCCHATPRSLSNDTFIPEVRSTIVVDERGTVVKELDLPKRPRRNQNEPEPLFRRRSRRIRFCPILDYTQPVVIQASQNESGRCIISADQAVHYCGFSEEVSAPPIPPPETGRCHLSDLSGREICYPKYAELDTSCTDVRSDSGNGLVAPPVVKHATVRAMAFVPPDNLRRLIRQYYRQLGKPIPADTVFSPQSFLFVKYKCEFGYEFVDEIDTMYCQDKQWVQTPPICKGKGPCEQNNGGCSHSCFSFDNRTIECRCPKGLILDSDKQSCIKPVPKNLCRNLAGCRCSALDDNQFSCQCGNPAEKCLLLKGTPKIYLTPNPPFNAIPGGSVNITCQAVGYPFPQIIWHKEGESVPDYEGDPKGVYRAEQILMVKEVYKNTKFVCTAKNTEGITNRTVQVNVQGPGSAPILRSANAGRTSIQIVWDPPHIQNNPITSYTLYYTTNQQQPLKFWKKMHVNEPNRQVTIPYLQPNRTYFIRVRALDKLGPGKPSQTVSVNTLKPPTPPLIEIVDSAEKLVAPNTSFSIGCNVVQSDPTPTLHWIYQDRPITQHKATRLFTIEHVGLIQDAVFTCFATNEAGTDIKNVSILIAGPSVPERVRYNVDGTSVQVFWEEPKYFNSELKDYEILFTKDPSLPIDEWESKKVANPAATTAVVDGLDEETKYTFKIRAISDRGPGLVSLPFDVQTWLGPQAPTVTLTPFEPITSTPKNVELVFNCEAIGVPKPKIVWLYDGLPIEDGKNDYRVYEVKPNDDRGDKTASKLTAQSTTRSGAITCQSINKHGQDEKVVDVKILGPGSPPRNIKPTTNENGFTVDFEQPEISNGPITKYIIYYAPEDTAGDLSDYSTKVIDGTDRSVTIDDQDENTPFVFRMQAVSDDGPGIISETYMVKTGEKHIPLLVRLEVSDPTPKEGEDTVVEPKQQITFRCIAEGRPEPTVSYSWLPLNNTESGEEPVTVPITPAPGREYRYQTNDVTSFTSTRRKLLCQARNQDGTVADSSVFIVLKPGSPPKDISFDVDTDNRVTIKWKEPDYPNGDITGYNLYLVTDPDKPINEWQVFDVPATDGEPKFELGRGELKPDTPYYVKIAAKNADGEGIPSDPGSFETVSGAPIDAPTDIVVDIAEDNTLNISWSGPKQPNGPIEGYVVYFIPEDPEIKDENYNDWPHVEVLTTKDTGFVSLDNDEYNIQPDTDYKTRVSAKNDMNEGPASEPVTFKTGSGELPPVVMLEPDDNPFLVAPKANVAIKCTATGVPQPTVKWIVGDETRLTPELRLTDVRKDITVTCIASNNAGENQASVDVQVLGPGTPPNEVVALSLPNQEINVEWTAPDEPNGKITEYIIHYGEISEGTNEPTKWDTISVPGDDVNHKIPNVKPKADYSIKVQAVSDRGPGVESNPVRVHTLPLAPIAPEAADVAVHDNNTVVIKFDAVPNPENITTNIKSYKIVYTPEDPGSDTTIWKELIWNQPDDNPEIVVPVDGENFSPETKYTVKVIPIGDIEGPASENSVFQTSDGIIPPEPPVINADLEPGNIVRVPAGSDYTVTCTSQGFPAPFVRWVDENGIQLSSDGMLRVYHVRIHKKAKCIAENAGGVQETDFTIYVAGPGNAPENIRVSSNHPRTIDVRWDPPTIRNGNITRYIIYYTPLDDQERAFQVGQVPKRPISEWMTYHVVGEHLNEGEKHARLTDFVDADTAYAIVIQAANEDGPGPYSIQHSIRTMSKAREAAPKDLRVNPSNQTSAFANWKPPEPSDEALLGYELYYIEADKEINEDDIISLPKWEKIAIDDPSQLTSDIVNLLKSDTEYVFKIRAIYANGPGVFSEACITKTPPEGTPPYIIVSAGGHGVYGTTEIDLLPGSSFDVFCNATGNPQPSVKWIRGGDFAIDPSMVKSDDIAAEWSLRLSNLTEDTVFLCFAHNPLGKANWTIQVKINKNLPYLWAKNAVKTRIENNEPIFDFGDILPENLKEPGKWTVYYTDEPSLPLDQWKTIPGNENRLDRLAAPELIAGTPYHVVVVNKKDGITSPTFTTVAPKPPSDVRVGSNINDETVIDFKPAISSDKIKEHIIKYWSTDDEDETNFIKIKSENITGGTILDGLIPGREYVFQPIAQLADGNDLVGDKTTVIIPTDDTPCECSHACKFGEDVGSKPTCYCPSGYMLAEDQKTCAEITVNEEKEFVQSDTTIKPEKIEPQEIDSSEIPDGATTQPSQKILTFPVLDTVEQTSPVPTDETGATIVLEDKMPRVLPTDELGREIRPIIFFDGKPLYTDETGNVINPRGEPIEHDDFGFPIDPDGVRLKQNNDGTWLYPAIDKNGNIYPTDTSGKHVFSIVDAYGTLEKDESGANVDRKGIPVPTDQYGKPVDKFGQILATDTSENYVLPPNIPLKTMISLVDENEKPIPTNANGGYIDRNGNVIEIDDKGQPLGPDKQPLSLDNLGRFVLPSSSKITIDNEPVTTPNKRIVIVTTEGQLLPTDATGAYVNANGEPIHTDEFGKPLSPDGQPLPTDSLGRYVFSEPSTKSPIKPTTISGQLVEIVGPDGQVLPTDESGDVFHPDTGVAIPTNSEGQYVGPDSSPLPTDANGNAIVISETETTSQVLPTDESGKIVYPIIGSDGQLLPTDVTGAHVNANGEPFQSDDFGKPLNSDGQPLPTDSFGRYVFSEPSTKSPIKPTTVSGQLVEIVGPDGQLLPTDESGDVIHPDTGVAIPTNSEGQYVGPDSSPLPTDANDNVIVVSGTERPLKILPTDESGKIVYPIIGSDGQLLPTDATGAYVNANGELIHTDEFGKPLSPDGQPLPTDSFGRYVFSEPSTKSPIKPTTVSGQLVEIVGPDGQLLPTDESGDVVHPDTGIAIPTNSEGQYVGPDSSPLPTNADGNVIVVSETEITPQVLPTDESGKLVYPIIGSDGQLLPTDATGAHVNANGEPFQSDDFGKPLNSDGQPLPTDSFGRYVFSEPSTKSPIKPTTVSGQLVEIVGPDGQLLPTDESGDVIHPDTGVAIPTNSEGQYVGPDSSPLPTNADGNVIVVSETEITSQVLPTDESGKLVYPIIGSDGQLLPTDATGAHVNANGEPFQSDDFGKPLNSDGQPLPTDSFGRYIFSEPSTDSAIKPTTVSGQLVEIVGPDGQLLPTDESGDVIHPDTGVAIPTNSEGQYVGPDSSPLPTNADGNAIIISETESTPQVLPTDESGKLVYPIIGSDGQLLPTDATGAHVNANGEPFQTDDFGKPLNSDGQPLPTDSFGRYIFSEPSTDSAIKPTTVSGQLVEIVGPDGQLLPTDESGDVIHPDTGVAIPTNSEGQYVGPDSSPLPTNADGNVIVVSETEITSQVLPTDESGKLVYPIIGSDGQLLPTDATGAHVNANGEPFQTDDFGKPLNSDGQPLPTDSFGRYVFSEPSTKSPIKPTTVSGQLVEIVGPDGQLLPTDESGDVIHPDTGVAIPTNSEGQYVGPDSSPLPTNADGNAIIISETESTPQVLPTDESGKLVYPIIGSDGQLLPTDATGAHVNANGEPFQSDDFGKPLNSDGQPLPTDSFGRYIFSEPSTDSAIKPTTVSGQLVEIVGPDGQLLPTDESGDVIHPDTGVAIPTNSEGQYVGPDSSPLPTDANDNVIVVSGTERPLKILPTDESGKIVYPIIGSDGQLLPTDATGAYVNANGEPIHTDEFGKPLSPDGQPLPTDSFGRYIFSEPSTDSAIKPTTVFGQFVEIVGPDGQVLPTDESGDVIHPDTGVAIPTNSEGQYVGPDSSPLPTNADGNVIVVSETEITPQVLPTDESGKLVYPIIGSDGQLLPTDATGAHVNSNFEPIQTDDFGKPLNSDGQPLPTDSFGRYVFSEPSTKSPIKPTTISGQLVEIVGPDGQVLPTDESGDVVHPDTGIAIPTNSEGQYVGPDSSPLPTNANGNAIVISETETTSQVLPTDESGKIVYPIIGSDGQLLPTDVTGAHVNSNFEPIQTDEFGKPLYSDGQPLPTDSFGRYVFSEPSTDSAIKPTTVSGQLVEIVGPDGQLLPTDESGDVIHPDTGVAIPTNSEGQYVGPDSSPLPTDANGNAIVISETESTPQVLPTDESGKLVYPIIGSDGQLLPTDATGAHVNSNFEPIQTDDFGKPLNSDGQPLPTDSFGRYVFSEPSTDAAVQAPTSFSHIVEVVDPDSQPSTTETNELLSNVESSSAASKTSAFNLPVDSKVCDLKAGKLDVVFIVNADLLKSYGHIIRVVIVKFVEQHLDLSPDVSRVSLIEFGKNVEVPITLGGYNEKSEFAELLKSVPEYQELGTPNVSAGLSAALQQIRTFPQNSNTPVFIVFSTGDDFTNVGKFITEKVYTLFIGPNALDFEYRKISLNTLFLEEFSDLNGSKLASKLIEDCMENKLQISSVIHRDEPNNDSTDLVNAKPVSNNCDINLDEAHIIILIETSDYTVAEKSHMLNQVSAFVETINQKSHAKFGVVNYGYTTEAAADIGNYENSAELTDTIKDIHFINGEPRLKDALRSVQQLFQEHADGTSRLQALVIVRKTKDSDASADLKTLKDSKITVIDLGITKWNKLNEDFYQWSQRFCTDVTEVTLAGSQTDKSDKLTTPSIYVHQVDNSNGAVPSSTTSSSHIVEIVGPDGQLLPTDESGDIVHPDTGVAIPTNSEGQYVGPDSSPLPTDANGNAIVISETESTPQVLPTDESGKLVYPIIGSDGQLLPTDVTGAHVNANGEPFQTDDFGKPLNSDGQPLPTDSFGRYVFSEPSTKSPIKPTTVSGQLVEIVGPDGQLLPTDESGDVIHPDTGVAIPTNSEGQYVGPDSSPLPTNADGNAIIISETESTPQVLPTDESGKLVYPIIGSDGQLLPTDATGAHVNANGKPFETDDFGKPLNSDGQPLPTDSFGRYVFSEPSTKSLIKPTTISGQLVEIVGPDGQVLPTDESGDIVHPDTGIAIPTNSEGQYVGPDSSPLPTNAGGNAVVVSGTERSPQTLPTDESGKFVYPVVDTNGILLPTDSTGAHVDIDGNLILTDDFGRPLGVDSNVLPTDTFGRYVYPYAVVFRPTISSGSPVVVVGANGEVLPTDADGFAVDPDSGSPILTNVDGSFVDHSGRLLPTNAAGNSLLLPTDNSGRVLYPIVSGDFTLLPTDNTGSYVDSHGIEVPRDDDGKPFGVDGEVLPTNPSGQYIYVEHPRPSSPYCHVTAFIDLVLVFDTSNHVKILDYRVMKEAAKQFLEDYFNLNENRVRVGLVKYGDSVEVPVALGDYDHAPNLLSRIGDTRRLRGDAHLGQALRDVATEFVISGVSGAPRVVIIFKSGPSADDIATPIAALRDELNAQIFVAAVGNTENEDLLLVGESNQNHISTFKQWRGVESSDLGVLAQRICEAIPIANQSSVESTWPARKTTVSGSTTNRVCNRVEYPADVIVVVDSSTFDESDFDHLKENIGVLVDESFDLSPDVVRIGFIVYTDKVSVPVALGHYEDKIELLQKIGDSYRISGVAIALKSLDAARQQFILHGREDVSKVVILITNGNNRGNAALAAQDLRDLFGIQIFVIAVNPTPERYGSLSRLVGTEHANERLIKVNSVDALSGEELSILRQSLCDHITPAAGYLETTELSWTTTKRDVYAVSPDAQLAAVTPSYLDDISLRTTRAIRPMPLCKDGYLRPYLLSVVVDVTARSTSEDFRRVLSMISEFLEDKFGFVSDRMSLNLVAVNSVDVSFKKSGLTVGEFSTFTLNLAQNENDEVSPKLGLGIDTAVELAKSYGFYGVNKIILVISSDATSSDDIRPAAEVARSEFEHRIVAVSIREPTTQTLTEISDNSPTRVIHLSDWTYEELFNSWFSYAVCEAVTASTQPKATTVTTKRPQKTTQTPGHQEPSNVKVIPVSPTSFTVTWTCCTNNKADYVIMHTPDVSLPRDKWLRVPARCRDSFGKLIDNIPSDSDYKVCVVTASTAANNSVVFNDDYCDHITLNADTTAPPDYEPWDQEQQAAPCQCRCADDGSAVIQSSCNQQSPEAFRPVATLPPAVKGECPCSVKAHSGRCPSGYFLQRSLCIDVNECQQQNGGCSHGCINTPGDFYCACPHGMMRDPADPKTCINVAGSFDRITELLAQYLHANSKHVDGSKVGLTATESEKGPRYKATIKTDDDKVLSFEWPAMVRKALRWLI